MTQNLTTIIVLQARIGSTRFPGKVLKPIQGLPLLSHCIRRLQRIDDSVPVVVATSESEKDDEIESLAVKEGVECYRGSQQDVLDRYYRAACRCRAKLIVRATGDNPFVDTEEGRRVFEEIVKGGWDFVTMIDIAREKRLPTGVGLEAFTFSALERAWREGHLLHHREHVNEYFLENPCIFRTRFLLPLPMHRCPDLRLTVDALADLRFVCRMVSAIGRPALDLATEEIVAWWRSQKTRS